MATKPLKTLTFEGLNDTYTVPQVDSTLSVTGDAADAKATGDALAAKADKIGNIALAERLYGGEYVSESEPYHFRKAPEGMGSKSETIVGGSLGWNQLANVTAHTDSRNGITYEYRNDGTVLVNGTATADSYSNIGTAIQIQGHKILMIGCPSGGSASTYYLRDGYNSYEFDVGNGRIVEARANTLPQINVKNGVTVSNLVFKPQVIDLTTLFGTTIADYIYSLETANAGAGVAWVKRYIDLDTYHEYDSGSIQSVEGLESHNTYDEDENLLASYPLDSSLTLRGVPKLVTDHIEFDGDKYYADGSVQRRYGTATFNGSSSESWYKSSSALNGFYISMSALGMKEYGTVVNSYGYTQTFSVHDYYNNYGHVYTDYTFGIDIDPSLCGSTVESFKTYLASHPITIVYELATPTTENAQPFQSPMIVGATEEYISDSVVPVGHESKYYEDVAKKVSGLPKDFSTLIAPVEVAFTATRNYSVGNYLIVKNQLYKVTSAISTGGTITPNSNVTATTIMAEILALA